MQLNPKALPDLSTIRRRAKTLALLDAIICPEWEYRTYSFDAHWGEGEEMASMRNGSGDEWFLLFSPCGAAIKGFAHESVLARDQIFAAEIHKQLPRSFFSFLTEPALAMNDATFCYWRETNDMSWHKVIHPAPVLACAEDGSLPYLALLFEPASAYQQYAREYFQADVPLSSIESLYAHDPLTPDIVASINPKVEFAEVAKFVVEIGYPTVSL